MVVVEIKRPASKASIALLTQIESYGTAQALGCRLTYEYQLAGRMCTMPNPFPAEFLADVVAVARQ